MLVKLYQCKYTFRTIAMCFGSFDSQPNILSVSECERMLFQLLSNGHEGVPLEVITWPKQFIHCLRVV